MRQFEHLKEMCFIDEFDVFEDCYWACRLCDQYLDEDDDAMEFDMAFGGSVYIVETLDDLKEIKMTVYEGDNCIERSLYERPLPFDSAIILKSGTLAFWTANNNSGGPIYYMTTDMVKNYKHVVSTFHDCVEEGPTKKDQVLKLKGGTY